MEKYLKLTKTFLVGTAGRVHVVLGNETCDLDSAVSALVYGFFLHHKPSVPASSSPSVIPVLNIRRTEYALHTDVRLILGRCGLGDESLLTFRDDINLASLHAAQRLDLTLVDFHVLPPRDATLDDAVVEVIDHRPRVQPDRADIPTTIELVGSCCTLVAEKLLSADFRIPAEAIDMLYSAMMLDTVGLSETAGRKTPKDDAIAAWLEALQPSLDRNKIFGELQRLKHDDISKLTTLELLRRDLKVVHQDGLSVAITAVNGEMKEFLQRPQLDIDLKTFIAEQSSSAVVLMFLHVLPNSLDITRQLAVYSQNSCLQQQICDVLSRYEQPCLSLKRLDLPELSSNITAFNQENIKASRKAVLPIILENVDTLKHCL